MSVWSVQLDDNVRKKLRKFKSNTQLTKKFSSFVADIKSVHDPAILGTKKHGKYKNCFGKHITKSHSVIYMIRYIDHIVYVVDLDDHKNLYWRDNRP